MTLTIGLIALFGLLALKTPIGMSLAISGVIYLWATPRPFPYTIVVERMVSGLDSYPFLAVPFFILAGHLMNSGGITRRIFEFALSLVGHVRGGLGHVNIVASLIFSGMSGAAVADTAGLGLIEINAMKNEGYSPEFSAAVTAASATIGPIIPPSVTLVLYGVLMEASIGRLFLGGILPGLFMGFSMMAIVYYLAVTGKVYAPTRPRQTLVQIGQSFRDAFLTLLTPFILLSGIAFGIVTPTEAGVLAVLYAILLGFVYKEFNIKQLGKLLQETGLQTASVMFIVAGAVVFSWVLTVERVPIHITRSVLAFSDNPAIILALLNILLLVLGMFLNSSTILVLTIPVLKPIIGVLGIDPVHFGVVMTLNVMIGMLTPPLGVCLYIATDIAKAKFEHVLRATIPFYIALVAVLILITYVPNTVLWLPNLVFNR